MHVGLGLGLGFGSYVNSAWSPKKIGGIALWLRADLGVTLVSSHVSAWANQSGAGDANRNAAQATAGNRPTQNATDAAYNNQATLSFASASSQFLQTGVWSAAPAQPFSLFVVGNDSGGGGEAYADDLTLDHLELFTIFGAYSARAGAVLTSGDAQSNAPRVLGAVFKGAASRIYNSAKTARATGDAGTLSATGLTIGASGDGSRPLNGKIAEVVGVSGDIGSTDLSTLFDYFAARYGITIGA